MKNEDLDFTDDAAAPLKADLSVVGKYVDKLRQAQEEVAVAQAVLDEKIAILNQLQLQAIPQAMEDCGLTEVKLRDGAILVMKEDVKVNISEINKAAAFAWLERTGHGSVIKEQMQLDKKSLSDAEYEKLREYFHDRLLTQRTVHPQTLAALVRELLERGVTIDPSISIFQYRKAVIKERK